MNKMNQELKKASKTGCVEVVKALLKCGADVHAENDYALRLASYHGHYEIVKILLENGANVHAENDYALRWASDNGHLEIVKVLLENGVNVHVDNSMKYAYKNGNTKMIKVLKDHIKVEYITISKKEYENLLETVKKSEE